MSKVVLIYSGGMDSFTLLNELVHNGENVHAVSFNYGQRHSKELDYAREVCIKLMVHHNIVELKALNHMLQGSSLTSGFVDVPEGHYSQDNMKATVVPNRNMIMLSIAVGYAVSIGAGEVFTAVHAGDHDVYPDCRKEFIDSMSAVTRISNYDPVEVIAPYLAITKADILLRGEKYAMMREYDYRKAWTCYKGQVRACGKCGACVERLEAFDTVGWCDPLAYDDLNFWKEAVANVK